MGADRKVTVYGFFEQLWNKSAEEVLAALKEWEHPISPTARYKIAQYPESIQQAILNDVKPTLVALRQRIGVATSRFGDADPRVALRSVHERGNALRQFFDKVCLMVNCTLGEVETEQELKELLPSWNPKHALHSMGAAIEIDTNEGMASGLHSALMLTKNDHKIELDLANAQLERAKTEVAQLKPSVEQLTKEKTVLAEELKTARFGFAGKVKCSFGAVGTVGKVLKGTGMALGFAGLVHGGQRVLNAVEVDKSTGEIRRNWTKTVAGAGEAALGRRSPSVAPSQLVDCLVADNWHLHPGCWALLHSSLGRRRVIPCGPVP